MSFYLRVSAPDGACPFGGPGRAKYGASASLQSAQCFCGSACLSDYGSLRLRRRRIPPLSPAESLEQSANICPLSSIKFHQQLIAVDAYELNVCILFFLTACWKRSRQHQVLTVWMGVRRSFIGIRRPER